MSKKIKRRNYTKAGWLLFYLYIILLSYFLFFSERYGRSCISDDYRYNLDFLKEIRRFIIYRNKLSVESFVVNILGNILAFAPYGFFLSLLNKRYRSSLSITILSILFSLTVEVVQMLMKVGVFDVDDILLNSLGGILGYLTFKLYAWIRKRIEKKGAGKGGVEYGKKR